MKIARHEGVSLRTSKGSRVGIEGRHNGTTRRGMDLSAFLLVVHARGTPICQWTRLLYLCDTGKLDEYDVQRRHNKADRYPAYNTLQS